MPKFKLIISILAAAAIVIMAMAIYIFTHFKSMSLASEIILAAIGVLILFLLMGIMFYIMRSSTKQ
jgi:hypothetical protein